MHSHSDGVAKEFLAEESEWTESNGAGLNLLEIAHVNQPIQFTWIMPFRLKPSFQRPGAAQLQQALCGHTQWCE
jgi:hypothetical protein